MNLLIAITCLNEDKTFKDIISSIPENFNGIKKFEVVLIALAYLTSLFEKYHIYIKKILIL